MFSWKFHLTSLNLQSKKGKGPWRNGRSLSILGKRGSHDNVTVNYEQDLSKNVTRMQVVLSINPRFCKFSKFSLHVLMMTKANPWEMQGPLTIVRETTRIHSINFHDIAILRNSSQSSVGRGGGRAVVFGVLVAVQLVSLHFLLGRLREQVRHRYLLACHFGNALQRKRKNDELTEMARHNNPQKI